MLIRKSNARTLYLCLVLFLLLSVRVGYCGYTADCAQAPTWTTGLWTESDCLRFEKSLDETAGPATPDRISNNLLAVVPPHRYEGPPWPEDRINRKVLNGGEISWEGVPGKSRIRVAAFMNRKTYLDLYHPCMFGGKDTQGGEHQPGGERKSVLKRGLWVTVAPELRNYFWAQPSLSCPPTKERIVQLLGLNPRRSYEVIVEMWVDPADLYRPTPDPEITDHRAEPAVRLDETINFRGVDCMKWAFPNAVFFFSTDQSYQGWFACNAAATYYNPSAPENTAPWTRLGYTYDWAATRKHAGASEFMIKLHPDVDGYGTEGAFVTYIRAIKAYDKSWSEYFRCEYRGGGIKSDRVPHADINLAAEQLTEQ